MKAPKGKKNTWYAVTGAPCSGKTTLLNKLAEKGYHIVPEEAREYIDESLKKGTSVKELRKDETAFQSEILRRKYEVEKTLAKGEVLFFDRGIQDSYAYFKFLEINEPKLLKKSLGGKYAKVFILDYCPYKKDYARTEKEEDQPVLDALLEEGYKKAGMEIIRVPILPTKDERVDFVLAHL